MDRARSAAAVLPALIPGACVALLAFQAGGFFPGSWAPLAAVAAVALAVRVATVPRPFAGVSVWSGMAAAALALFGARPVARWSSSAACSSICSCWSCARRWRRASTGCRGRCAAWRWRSA